MIQQQFHQVRVDKEIADMQVTSRPEVHIAKNPAQSPEVLAFQVSAVAIAIHLDGQHIRATDEELGDVKDGRRAGALAVADTATVYP